MEEIKSKRGRPKKIQQGNDEIIAKHMSGVPLTLQETQQLIATTSFKTYDPITGKKVVLQPKKYSLMGLQKIEVRALAKLKKMFEDQYRVKSMSDALHTSKKFTF